MSQKALFFSFSLSILLSIAAAAEDPGQSAVSVSEPAATVEPNYVSADPNQSAAAKNEPSFGISVESPLPQLYRACEQIFNVYVDDAGDVNYSLLRRKRGDLIDAMKILEQTRQEQLMPLSRPEKQAFWINAYNLCILRLIIDNYPIEPKWYMIIYPDNSIMQISNPWTKHYFTIGGLEYNLQEIEKGLLLDRWRDVRICFALSGAAVGGAMLRNEPYYADRLDEQLNDQIRKYISSPQGCRLDKTKNVLYLSNLFNTYRKEFLDSKYASIKRFRSRPDIERAWLNFLAEYLPAEDGQYLEGSNCSIQLLEYSWLLNETRK